MRQSLSTPPVITRLPRLTRPPRGGRCPPNQVIPWATLLVNPQALRRLMPQKSSAHLPPGSSSRTSPPVSTRPPSSGVQPSGWYPKYPSPTPKLPRWSTTCPLHPTPQGSDLSTLTSNRKGPPERMTPCSLKKSPVCQDDARRCCHYPRTRPHLPTTWIPHQSHCWQIRIPGAVLTGADSAPKGEGLVVFLSQGSKCTPTQSNCPQFSQRRTINTINTRVTRPA